MATLVQASGSLDGSARVWRPAEGEGAAAVAVLEGHDGPVTALAAGVDAVRRRTHTDIDQLGITIILTVPSHATAGLIAGTRWAGKQGGVAWLATASADRSIVVWALASAAPLARVAGCHGLSVCALAWLPELVPDRPGGSFCTNNATESVHPIKNHLSRVNN
jgi:WD40 repeat protein